MKTWKTNFKCARFFAAGFLFFLLISCVDPASGTLTEEYKYPKELWGEWIRMDTGKIWYITSNYLNTDYTTVTGSYSAPSNGIVLIKESSKVIRVEDPNPGSGLAKYYLYASRIPNGSFSGTLTDNLEPSSPGRSLLGGVKVTVSQIYNEASSQQVETGDDGGFTANGIIPGDGYLITADGISTPVTPNTDGEDIGTVTIMDGANFKTSIAPQTSRLPSGIQAADLMRLYADNTEYYFNIEAVNTGSDDFSYVSYKLEIPEELTIVDAPPNSTVDDNVVTGIHSTIRRGDSAALPIRIKCPASSITEESAYFKILIELTDHAREVTWNDSVSLRFNQAKVTFNIRSTAALGSDDGKVSGVIIVPGAKSYYFQTSGSKEPYTADVTVPHYSRDDYYIIFSGANYKSEAHFSFAIDQTPPTNFSVKGTELFKYSANNAEAKAAKIEYTDHIMAFLAANHITYFQVDMRAKD
jgi:hypothetical protein